VLFRSIEIAMSQPASRSSLLGHRGRALYPPRSPPSLLTRRGFPSATTSMSGSFVSRQSLMLLTLGVLFGYLILPVLLVQHLGFDDMTTISKSTSPSILDKIRNNNDEYKNVNSHFSTRHLSPSEEEKPEKKKEGIETDEQEEGLDLPIESEEEKEQNAIKLIGDSQGVATADKPTDEKSTVAKPGVLTAIQARLVEDNDLTSKQSIPTSTTPTVMYTTQLPDHQRKKILVTGGAGFVGSHLVDKLMVEGHEVIVVDNFFTGQKKNIAHWLHHPNFSLIVHDVTESITLEVDQIYHLACPASPPHYQYNPVKTIKTSTMGTLNMLGLAKRTHARMLLTSTSEVYGDPKVHPQHESYWGNVNTIGPRACYDEGKRVAETMMYSYRNQNQVEVRVARIFNTFGPRMHPNDGRVVSNFIIQSLQDKNITIYGQGEQTRSFQYVSDLVDGLHSLMNGNYDLPVNLGNPDEYSVKKFAEYIKKMTGSKSEIIFLPKNEDDPSQRRPDISTAKREINWEPKVTVENGLKETIKYFQSVLDAAGEIIPTGPGATRPEA